MATVLNLKPVLQIQGGKLDAFRKARGMQQAKKVMSDAMHQDLETRFSQKKVRLFASYSGLEEEGQAWLQEVQAMFPERNVELFALPISICCHVGRGALAIACAAIL
jgi:fatty acid-binding protein DegV